MAKTQPGLYKDDKTGVLPLDYQDRDKGNWHFDGNKINVVAFKRVAKARRENTNGSRNSQSSGNHGNKDIIKYLHTETLEIEVV